MENQISAEQALKTMAVTQAAANYKWNEAIQPEFRSIIIDKKVAETLDALGASLEVVNGQVEIHRKGSPGMQYYDEHQRRISVNDVVSKALNIQQAAPVKPGEVPAYERISDSEYKKNGVTHVKHGTTTYIDPIEKKLSQHSGAVDYGKAKTSADVVKQHIANLNADLGINP